MSRWCSRVSASMDLDAYEEGEVCVPEPVEDEPTERIAYCLGCGRPVDAEGAACAPCGGGL
jgi:hypothetical protein